MTDYRRGDERIMRVTEVNRGQTTWVRVGDLVRCEKCANWGSMPFDYPPDWCPVVQKCTRPSDWCCWGAGKEADDER